MFVEPILGACRRAGRASACSLLCSTWCLTRCSAQTCDLAITSSDYRALPVITEQLVWSAQAFLDGACWCQRLVVVQVGKG